MVWYSFSKVSFYLFTLNLWLCLIPETSGNAIISTKKGSNFDFSANNVMLHQARRNCAEKGRKLAELETKQQINDLKRLLRDFSDGQEGFWVDALYDPRQGGFVWQESAELVKHDIEGAKIEFEEKPDRPDQDTGLQVKYRGAKLWYVTAPMNVNQKYVCQRLEEELEAPKPEIQAPEQESPLKPETEVPQIEESPLQKPGTENKCIKVCVEPYT